MIVSYNFLDDILGYTSESGSGSSNSTLRGLNDTLENLDSNSTQIGDEQLDTEAVSLSNLTKTCTSSLSYPHITHNVIES